MSLIIYSNLPSGFCKDVLKHLPPNWESVWAATRNTIAQGLTVLTKRDILRLWVDFLAQAKRVVYLTLMCPG